jgi:hypothetical protein
MREHSRRDDQFLYCIKETISELSSREELGAIRRLLLKMNEKPGLIISPEALEETGRILEEKLRTSR